MKPVGLRAFQWDGDLKPYTQYEFFRNFLPVLGLTHLTESSVEGLYQIGLAGDGGNGTSGSTLVCRYDGLFVSNTRTTGGGDQVKPNNWVYRVDGTDELIIATDPVFKIMVESV